jgi:transcriptional regulator with XRE-family HTH domain
MSPLGETLRRARLNKGITFEDAERVTRIPRKYLEALETENYGILPAPLFARGFLRSYAGYLGLDPAELLPFFPVGHVEEPKLEPLPQVKQPQTWNMSSVVALGVIGALILIVVGLYSIGSEDSSPFANRVTEVLGGDQAPGVITPPEGQERPGAGIALALPDLAGQSLEEAIQIVEETGATFIVVGVRQGDVPVGQVIDHDPPPGTPVGPGDVVTLKVSR